MLWQPNWILEFVALYVRMEQQPDICSRQEFLSGAPVLQKLKELAKGAALPSAQRHPKDTLPHTQFLHSTAPLNPRELLSLNP